MASYLITGSSRGIGLELATQLSKLPASEVGTVFASARSETPAITDLIKTSSGKVVFVQLDNTAESSIKSAVEQVTALVKGKGLDVLVNNAGIMSESGPGIENMTNLTEHFNVNVFGMQNVTMAFLPLLRQGKSKKIVNITSTLGSMALAGNYGTAQPAYRISKAAVNMLTVQWSLYLAPEDFAVIMISPGWLKTDLGSSYADLDVAVGAKATLEVLRKATKEDSGRFLNIKVEGWEHGKPGAEKGEGGPNVYDGVDAPW